VTGIDTRKKFIDKELDRESTTYNTGVRQYDPEGPGFASVDPLWEEFRAWTPYHYAHDNPVGLKDPSGLQVGEKNDNGGGGAISPAGGSVAPEGYWSVRPVFRGLSRFWRNLTGTNSGGGSAATAPGAGVGTSSGSASTASSGTIPPDGGLAERGFRPPPGTRVRPSGIPGEWKVRPTKKGNGVLYSDPKNPGNSVRVMPGKQSSPYPNSQKPYVRWQKDGQALDQNGNPVPKTTPSAHIPLGNFKFGPVLIP